MLIVNKLDIMKKTKTFTYYKIQFHSRYFFDNTIAPDFFNMHKNKHYPELK